MEDVSSVQISQLVEFTIQKVKHLESILVLTESQKKALSEDDLDRLNLCIAEKQIKIDSINELDKKFENVYLGLQTKPLKISPVLQAQVAKVQELTEKIRILEKENQIKANTLIEEIKSTLQDVSKGQRGLNAYKKAAMNESFHLIDKKE